MKKNLNLVFMLLVLSFANFAFATPAAGIDSNLPIDSRPQAGTLAVGAATGDSQVASCPKCGDSNTRLGDGKKNSQPGSKSQSTPDSSSSSESSNK